MSLPRVVFDTPLWEHHVDMMELRKNRSSQEHSSEKCHDCGKRFSWIFHSRTCSCCQGAFCGAHVRHAKTMRGHRVLLCACCMDLLAVPDVELYTANKISSSPITRPTLSAHSDTSGGKPAGRLPTRISGTSRQPQPSTALGGEVLQHPPKAYHVEYRSRAYLFGGGQNKSGIKPANATDPPSDDGASSDEAAGEGLRAERVDPPAASSFANDMGSQRRQDPRGREPEKTSVGRHESFNLPGDHTTSSGEAAGENHTPVRVDALTSNAEPQNSADAPSDDGVSSNGAAGGGLAVERMDSSEASSVANDTGSQRRPDQRGREPETSAVGRHGSFNGPDDHRTSSGEAARGNLSPVRVDAPVTPVMASDARSRHRTDLFYLSYRPRDVSHRSSRSWQRETPVETPVGMRGGTVQPYERSGGLASAELTIATSAAGRQTIRENLRADPPENDMNGTSSAHPEASQTKAAPTPTGPNDILPETSSNGGGFVSRHPKLAGTIAVVGIVAAIGMVALRGRRR